VENKDEGREGKTENLIASLVVYYLDGGDVRRFSFVFCSLQPPPPFNRPHPSNHLLLQPPSISLLNNGETLYYVPVSAAEILRTQEWLKVKKIVFVISQRK